MKLISTLAALFIVSSAAAETFESNYDLTLNKSASTMTIHSSDGMVHVCDTPMFPAGTYRYSLTGSGMNLRANTDAGLDFDYVSGGRNSIEGSWSVEDEEEGIRVTMIIGSSSLKVVSECE